MIAGSEHGRIIGRLKGDVHLRRHCQGPTGALRAVGIAINKGHIDDLGAVGQRVLVVGVGQVVQDRLDRILTGIRVEGQHQRAGAAVVGDGGNRRAVVGDRGAVVEQLQARRGGKAAADRDEIDRRRNHKEVVGAGAGTVNHCERGTAEVGLVA